MRGRWLVGLYICSAMTMACSVNLGHGPLDPVERLSGEVALRTADNMSAKVGWGTATAFAIPVARVTINGKADEALALQVKSALEHVGYRVSLVNDASGAAGMPYVECHVNRFKFRNYTWFFPLVWNWGKIDVTMRLTPPDGGPIWERQYVGKAKGFYSFESTVNKALTRLLNQVAADLAKRQQAAAGPAMPGSATKPALASDTGAALEGMRSRHRREATEQRLRPAAGGW